MSLGAWLRRLALVAFHVGIARPLLKYFWGARFRKLNLVPRGPCLVVANHNSHLDAALLMSIFPVRRLHLVHPVAAADYFGETWLRRTMAMLFMNAIPIQRRPQPGTDPLAPMKTALERGESLILFPEGSRGEPGVVAPFRSGVGRLAREVPGLLVVPVFLAGPERIWPRGETMPLPLGIDVTIGRPRTYDPELESKAIAEAVREDVLALAPPPLPLPGPRPSPPVRIAVCGIDPGANRDLFVALLPRLGALGRTIGLGDTILEADAKEVREAGARVPLVRSTFWPAVLGTIFRTSGLYRGGRFAAMVERARVDEALSDGRTARFVAAPGSPLLDLLAWTEADVYEGRFDEKGLQQLLLYLAGQRKVPLRSWWEYARKAPEVWLLNTFDLAHPPVPSLVVLLTLSPERAVERLRSRGEEIAPFQNERTLEKLQAAYRQVASVVRKPGRTEVLELDASDLDVEEAAERVESVCRRIAASDGATQAQGAR